MPTIRETAKASETKTCELPRIDWYLLLKSIPPQTDVVIERMRTELLAGCIKANGADVVNIEVQQVLAMCNLAPEEPELPE